MIKDAMDLLLSLPSDNYVKVDETPEQITWRDQGDGTTRTYAKPAAQRKFTALDIASLVSMAFRFTEDASRLSFYVGSTIVGASLKDAGINRPDFVKMDVNLSDLFGILERVGREWNNQKDMIRLFRHELAGCQMDPGNVRSVIESLKLDRSENRAAELKHGEESVKASIRNAVTGADRIPETVDISFHPFPSLSADMPGDTVDVTCSLFIDAVGMTLNLRPQLGQLDDARAEAIRLLADAVRAVVEQNDTDGKNVPVFCGDIELLRE